MPFPTPFNTLVAAYRVYYLRCVCYIIKYLNYIYKFNKATSKKYSYYTMQNALCHPVNVRNRFKTNININLQ
jgi:hypothetical protein